jgi:hypothetical protein
MEQPKVLHWKNFECEFSTLNTKNTFGNSTYYVWADFVLRHAPINKERAPGQVRSTGQYIAYIQPADCERFMNSDETGILSMSGDIAVFSAASDQGREIFTASRIPAAGCRPFEFNLSQGVIVMEHAGSPIVNLQKGKPSIPKPGGARFSKAARCQIM